MKKIILTFIAILCASALHAQLLSGLHFSNPKIESISPISFTSTSGIARVECNNTDQAFTLTNISGMVYKKGQPFVSGTAKDIEFPLGQNLIRVVGTANLCPGISLWNVLACIIFDPDDYAIDVRATIVYSDGTIREADKRNIPLRWLLASTRGPQGPHMG